MLQSFYAEASSTTLLMSRQVGIFQQHKRNLPVTKPSELSLDVRSHKGENEGFTVVALFFLPKAQVVLLEAHLCGVTDHDIPKHRQWQGPAFFHEFVVSLSDFGLVLLWSFVDLLQLLFAQRRFP